MSQRFCTALEHTFSIFLANSPVWFLIKDLFAAMGKNGQFIDILPSENLVVIRMGQAPDDSLVPILFHDEMWSMLMEVMN